MRIHYDGGTDTCFSDAILSEKLAAVTADGGYTILFLSSPGEPTYDADFVEPIQMDLKRHVRDGSVRRQSNESDWDRLPLFQKYQFFTPGKMTTAHTTC